MRDIQEGYKEYTIMSLIWREGQLKDVGTIHLGSSLSQAEEQGALFAGGGPVQDPRGAKPSWRCRQSRRRISKDGDVSWRG